jgi:FtsP/CotA-like multicopper oxidase with cupredoxin domain
MNARHRSEVRQQYRIAAIPNDRWTLYHRAALFLALALMATQVFAAGSFLVQCPDHTDLHPLINGKPNPGIKCQEIAGGDGYATMGDGTQMYLFGFGPLSGMDLVNAGKPGTQTAAEFNKTYNGMALPYTDTANGDAILANALYDPSKPENRNGAIVEPAVMMNVGVLNAQAPAPMMEIDEDDEFFLTLSNVGMIMRPDLFEQHTVHFHGYPNASSYFDGVPDVSIAINIAGSMTYYYTAPEAGTYFFHCHITPPEHIQMGMEGNLYVNPRQNKVPGGASLYAAAAANECSGNDILCANPLPKVTTATQPPGGARYVFDDGDGSTRYDVAYPMMMMGFDPNFHYASMTFNPTDFSGMKDKYFMLEGRSYPDTVNSNLITTTDSDGVSRPSQPHPALITIDKSKGQTRALLRLSNLSITEFHTLTTTGIPMHVVGDHARLLRDMDGNNMDFYTNSVTLGGGESREVILDATDIPQGTYFLYTSNLDHLSNDNENFGGMMTEIVVLE